MTLGQQSRLYDAYYFAHGCGRPYQRDEEWLRFFDSIAERIVSDIQPKTVLDAGCAMGFLVEHLRKRDIEAFGIDISEYAIQKVHPDIRPYCWVGSITDPLPQTYDLIVCIEVIEHLPPADARVAVENLCRHSDDILFSSTPLDYREVTHFNVQPPDYWAALFARQGFFRDIDFDATFITPWAARFRRARQPVTQVIAAYERRFWLMSQENQARREFSIEQRNELAIKELQLAEKDSQLAEKDSQLAEKDSQLAEKDSQLAEKEQTIQLLSDQMREIRLHLEQAIQQANEQIARQDQIISQIWGEAGWKLATHLAGLRLRSFPPGSRREKLWASAMRFLRGWIEVGFKKAIQSAMKAWGGRLVPSKIAPILVAGQVTPRLPLTTHQSMVDVIVCVHNALEDVKRCLESLVAHTTKPYNLILVDDGSEEETRDYLVQFASLHQAMLIRNEKARGYTCAANQGLRQSHGEYAVLLNSDTIVTPEWVDRMIACAESDPRIGLVGPLSNTASWQSIPEISAGDDWATNPLPEGMTIKEMGRLVSRYSARLYPPMPFLNGFCLLIRRQLIQEIGYLDEETFGAGYGEEDDYALRARQGGWRLALADDAYVYHAQSRSYSNERRKQLAQRAGAALAQKHGRHIIDEGVEFCIRNRVLRGIRVRARAMWEREEWIAQGRREFAGRRILFVLPVVRAGGGANVIINESLAMQAMGVQVHFFNLPEYRSGYEQAYSQFNIPVIYGQPQDLVVHSKAYDAIIGTINYTVEWIAQIERQNGQPVRGYYVQEFEPYMYSPASDGFHTAFNSYRLLPDLVRFTKTQWTRQEVASLVGVDCTVVGPSVDIDLFRPRPRSGPDWPERPLRIAAMVRPDSPYRAPALTMQLLRQAREHYKERVNIVVFGAHPDDAHFSSVRRDPGWFIAGSLIPAQVANLLNEIDIFVDFSSHQAMGLTALEAMACGAAVIVPLRGGATEFAQHEINSLVADTHSLSACWSALQRLIEDHELRARLGQNALVDACRYFAERPAYEILKALFKPE